MKNTRRLKFLSGVVVVLFWGFIMGGCQKEAIDSEICLLYTSDAADEL